MSILLEALRKSEKSQRSREVPTIHTEVPSGSASEAQRVLPIVLLIVIALVICGWFVWNQYWVPSDEGIIATDETAVSSSGQSSAEITGGDSSIETPGETGKKKENQPAAAVSNDIGANSSSAVSSSNQNTQKSDRPRTPTESYKAPSKKVANSAATANKDASKKTASTNPKQTKRQGVGPGAVDAAKASGSSSESGSPTSAGNKASKQDYQPGIPQPIGYWELPDSVREVVPNIKYSVLVYDKNPPDRFVLINGERLTEGDSLQPGLAVKEIRRDGVIFSYRLYQFLVEK